VIEGSRKEKKRKEEGKIGEEQESLGCGGAQCRTAMLTPTASVRRWV